MIINMQNYKSNRSQEIHNDRSSFSGHKLGLSGSITVMASKKQSPAVEKAILRAKKRPW